MTVTSFLVEKNLGQTRVLGILPCSQQTALMLAASQGYGAIIERLLTYGAEVNLQGDDGNTPLHIVLKRRWVPQGAEHFDLSNTSEMARILNLLRVSWPNVIEDKALPVACYLAM